jgi:hypothetical protein
VEKGEADGEARAAVQDDRSPVARGGVCGGKFAHFRVQVGPHGIPQPVFLQLIAGHERLSEA